MNRRDELIKIVGDDPINAKMIDYVIGLETRLDELEKNDREGIAPFYKFNPDNPQQQKIMPMFKAYKELLQQYTNCYKALAKLNDKDDGKDESPLRKWAANRNVNTG